MPKRKAKFTPKKKKTLVPEPSWDKYRRYTSDETQEKAYKECLDYVHYEVTEREQLHWLKKWVREKSGWDLHEETVTLPDVYMLPFAKYGWLAIMLQYVPKTVLTSLENNLKPLLHRADEFRAKHTVEEVALPDDKDHFLYPGKVKQWLAVWKDYLKGIDAYKESKDPKDRMKYQVAETYVYNMNAYLRTGVWNDTHFGENREGKVLWVCKALAYDKDGCVKRTFGTYYPDIGQVWTRELANET